jgi:hypothetical protein
MTSRPLSVAPSNGIPIDPVREVGLGEALNGPLESAAILANGRRRAFRRERLWSPIAPVAKGFAGLGLSQRGRSSVWVPDLSCTVAEPSTGEPAHRRGHCPSMSPKRIVYSVAMSLDGSIAGPKGRRTCGWDREQRRGEGANGKRGGAAGNPLARALAARHVRQMSSARLERRGYGAGYGDYFSGAAAGAGASCPGRWFIPFSGGWP